MNSEYNTGKTAKIVEKKNKKKCYVSDFQNCQWFVAKPIKHAQVWLLREISFGLNYAYLIVSVTCQNAGTF